MALLLLLLAGSVTLRLDVAPTTVRPGERVLIHGYASAETTTSRPSRYELVVRGPDGTLYRQRGGRNEPCSVYKGLGHTYVRINGRVDPLPGTWEPRRPPLRTPGEWTLWFESDGRSNEVKLVVQALSKEEIRTKPAAAHVKALDRMLRRVGDLRDDEIPPVWAALEDAREEGLAQHVLDLSVSCKSLTMSNGMFQRVVARAVSQQEYLSGPLHYGIDGPYLRALVQLVLEAWEAEEKGEESSLVLRSGLYACAAYVHFHPEDVATRQRLVKIVRRLAGWPDRAEKYREATVHAWLVLLELGELHAGMSVDDALAILGKPYGERAKNAPFLRWYLDSSHQVNLGLWATFADGKVTEFRIYRG